jgi:DNA-directed RNA polymerase subunit RPC12/RpoP
VKEQPKIHDKNIDNLENIGNHIDGLSNQNAFDDDVNVTATVNYNEVTGVDNSDGTNALEGIDDMDSINQMANMDNEASRKGMNHLFDTYDMQNTDGINNIDDLSSDSDIGYSEDENDPYWLACPKCHYKFQVAHDIVHDDISVTCPNCGYKFESEAHVI